MTSAIDASSMNNFVTSNFVTNQNVINQDNLNTINDNQTNDQNQIATQTDNESNAPLFH